MKQDTFNILKQLTRIRESKTCEAAKLVLVDGMRQNAAAKQLGITPQTVGKAVRTLKNAKRLANLI